MTAQTDKKKIVFDTELHTSTKPVAGISLYQGLEGNKEESPAEKIYDKMEATQAQALRGKQMEGLIKEATGEGQDASKRNLKRYLVDPGTGVISIDEEEGDLSYRDAVMSSASIIATLRAQGGDTEKKREFYVDDKSGVIMHDPENGEFTLSEARAIAQSRQGVSAPTEKKKEFYVDDKSGVIMHDPENGELTLSEARAVAQSRQRVAAPNEGITKEGLELLKRDLRDELKQNIENIGKGNQEPAFTFDKDGKPVLNPNSKGMSLSDVLAYQFITKPQNSQGMYKDDAGNIMALKDALDLKRFNNEEVRKDKKVDSLQEIITEARKQMPLIGKGIEEMLSQRNITRREISQEDKVAETEETPGGETLINQSAEV